MKAVISSILLTATAVANAATCDVNTLTDIASTADALNCKIASNFEVPVESTVNAILTNLESFCANDACLRVLAALDAMDKCSIEETGLHQSVIDPIDAVCTTRALRVADGSHVHSSGMSMGSASAEAEDSHEATSSSTASSEVEDSHDAASASSGAEDSHDTTYSASASATASKEEEHDSHDVASSIVTSTAGSTATTVGSKSSSGTSTGSMATSSNSTLSTQVPSASGTSAAASASIAGGSVLIAVAATFF